MWGILSSSARTNDVEAMTALRSFGGNEKSPCVISLWAAGFWERLGLPWLDARAPGLPYWMPCQVQVSRRGG